MMYIGPARPSGWRYPTDLPDSVLSQIGSRVQHALRAYTPNEQKNLRAAARSFRENPAFDTEAVLQELGVGEALVSVLDEKGIPTIVEKAGILPPRSSMSAAADEDIARCISDSPLYDEYSRSEDRRSAYEVLEEARQDALEREKAEARQIAFEQEQKAKQAAWEKEMRERDKLYRQMTGRSTKRKRQSPLEKTLNSAANTVGRELGKKLIRGLFGNLSR